MGLPSKRGMTVDSPANRGVRVVEVTGGEIGGVGIAGKIMDLVELTDEERVWGLARLRRE